MTVGESPFPVLAGISPSTSSRSPNGVTSASPPERLTRSASHPAARTTSSRCAGSALTDGIAMNSRSSSSQACSTGRTLRKHPKDQTGRSDLALRDFAQLRRIREGAQLLQALVLDLPDALSRDVERTADLVQRARMLPVEAVAQLEDLALAGRERAEDLAERLLPERDLSLLVRERQVLVREEVPKLGLVLVADRLLQGDWCLCAPADLLDLVRGQLQVAGDLDGVRLASELGAELALAAHDLVQLLDDVHRHPDRARLVGKCARNRLADPPGRVRRELEPLAVVELLGGTNEADRPFLDQIEEGQALVPVFLRDRDDEAKVRLDHLLLRAVVAALDPFRELDFLRGCQEIDLADVLQEELQRIRRDLARRLLDRRLVVVIAAGHDLGMELLERVAEVVDLCRLEVELVERDGDRVGAQVPGFASRLQ